MSVPLIDLKTQYKKLQPEIRAAIDRVLEKQQFILGEEGAFLEQEIADLCGTRFAIGCASGTDALLLSLLALGIGEGDEVITTAYSFFSTAGMIAWLKARPVFVDIDPDTFLLRPDQVASKITSKTRAIIGVDLFGQCCRSEELAGLGMPLIEDAAQAIGAKRNGKSAGALGVTGCFSFFPTKNLGAFGDGGMVTTNDENMARRIRQLRVHGEGAQKYLHEMVGTNSRLDEIQAAILRVKLKYLSSWNKLRNVNAEFYRTQLLQLPIRLPKIEEGNEHTFHQFVIRTEDRDRLRSVLTNKGIGSAVYYPAPLPLQPCFADLKHGKGDFPDAENCADTSLALPIHADLTPEQRETVVSTVRDFFEK
jgi:dTDP-4-amino-4,6-dideoxygalactose transaminase